MLGLAGCTVYVPTIPSTPLLSKGQLQVSAGLRNLNSVEGGAAWAPTRHLLLSAESALSSGNGSKGSFHRQLSLGAGYYHASAASHTYLAVLGGAGLAGATVYDKTLYLSLGLSPSLNEVPYQANYWRYYAQAYLASDLSAKAIVGFSLRTVYVDYTRLTYGGKPFASDNNVFVEPTFFVRAGNGPLQVQGAAGLSLPTHTGPDNQPGNSTSPISSLVGVALIFRPDLLKHRQKEN
ncbi:hypothetical protein HHL22_21640 [Hymenobacter sp. RP-2-7]|uniref:Outer membrane protein beta-barrel domain-containing protein n=1 Tax=Hymenobacter polaris TaxID=2682546 RepID=A0A7Y0FPW5_9BACT|nr:hypothetical protein [Hymenobacter polaris]NML67814.1 hypothetical protein [Hymenobacter polaris]